KGFGFAERRGHAPTYRRAEVIGAVSRALPVGGVETSNTGTYCARAKAGRLAARKAIPPTGRARRQSETSSKRNYQRGLRVIGGDSCWRSSVRSSPRRWAT